MGQNAVPSGGLLVALFILGIFGIVAAPILQLGDYWGQVVLGYLASLALTGVSFALRRNRGDPELYQIILRLLWPPALIGVAGLVSLLPTLGGFLAGLVSTAVVILTVVWSVLSLVEIGLSVLSAGRGIGTIEGATLRQRIFSLLDQIYLSGSRLNYTLEPGERIMMVLLESPFKNVYPRTLGAAFKALPLGAGISAAVTVSWMILNLFGNIKAILAGHFSMSGMLVTTMVLGTGVTALIVLPVVFWNWYIESWNRERRRWIFSSHRVWMLSIQAPLTVPSYSDGALDVITEIPVHPLVVAKSAGRTSTLQDIWSGLAYRMAKTASVVLPSRLMGATDTVVVDNALGVKQIIAALAKKCRENEALKRVAKELMARASITAELANAGVPARSEYGTPEEIGDAYKALAGGTGEGAEFDPWTVPDPGLCNPRNGKITETAAVPADGTPDMSSFARVVVPEGVE